MSFHKNFVGVAESTFLLQGVKKCLWLQTYQLPFLNSQRMTPYEISVRLGWDAKSLVDRKSQYMNLILSGFSLIALEARSSHLCRLYHCSYH